MMEITFEEQNKVKRMKRMEDSLRDLWDNIKCTNSLIVGGPRRRREKERVWENFWRDYSWNFLNMEKKIVNQVQEAQRVPYRINPRRNTPRHILSVSHSVMPYSLRSHGVQSTRLLCPWDFPGKDTEWVAISFSRRSSWPRDQTWVFHTASRLLPSKLPGKNLTYYFTLKRNSEKCY